MAATPQTITAQEAQFINSEIDQESGGNYNAISNLGALGKYQIMPANLPSWESEAGLPQEDSKQFLADHGEQDALGIFKLDKYYRQYGPSGAAAAWYSGKPTITSSQVQQYVTSVLGRMSGEPTTIKGDSAVQTTGGGSNTTPAGNAAVQPADLLQTFTGISSKDLLIRGGLILFGAIILLIGIFKFTSTGHKITATIGAAVKARTGGGGSTPTSPTPRPSQQRRSPTGQNSDLAKKTAAMESRKAAREEAGKRADYEQRAYKRRTQRRAVEVATRGRENAK